MLVQYAGLEPDRALREATRELQVEIRSFELDSDNDARVMGPRKYLSFKSCGRKPLQTAVERKFENGLGTARVLRHRRCAYP